MKRTLRKNVLPFLRKHRVSMMVGTYALANVASFLLSGEAFASKTIEEQLESVHKLTTGGVVKTGMGVGFRRQSAGPAQTTFPGQGEEHHLPVPGRRAEPA